ncbi:CLUMA_CG008325, isoform A [Clunio marinus]|uniref:CLUMA_CG008325, isoform A n=1 Tax=Clunio marinus TaxID=568069 RepID=A0A1J1I3B8_9DIPT|nr:CLUMA_CG008325, isoform A [Clunio marinus]
MFNMFDLVSIYQNWFFISVINR